MENEMTQDEIMEMAQECKLIGSAPHLDGIYMDALLSFAQLVAAKEREALKQNQSEPVAWMDKDGDIYKELPNEYWNPPHTPIYTKREWVGLTDEDLKEIKVCGPVSYKWVKVAEAKLKEKNT
jgi:hypothetical protein